MKKISILLIFIIILAFTGCSISINGKEVSSFDWGVGGTPAEKTELKDEPVDSQNKINVSNASGEIVLKPWAKNYIQIKAVKKLRGNGGQDKLNKLLDELKIEIKKDSSSIDINVKYINSFHGVSHQNVVLEITIPKEIIYMNSNSASGNIKLSDFRSIKKLEVSSVSGGVEANNLKTEEFDFGATSGEIEVKDIEGNGYIHTVSGSINISNVKGDIKCKTTSGSIDGNSTEGGFESSSISGSINLDSKYLKAPSSFKTISGSIDIRAYALNNEGEYKLNSISGQVSFAIPDSQGFNLDVGSISGNIRNEFSMKSETVNSRNSIKGVVGSGGPNFNISTISGGISVENN